MTLIGQSNTPNRILHTSSQPLSLTTGVNQPQQIYPSGVRCLVPAPHTLSPRGEQGPPQDHLFSTPLETTLISVDHNFIILTSSRSVKILCHVE